MNMIYATGATAGLLIGNCIAPCSAAVVYTILLVAGVLYRERVAANNNREMLRI